MWSEHAHPYCTIKEEPCRTLTQGMGKMRVGTREYYGGVMIDNDTEGGIVEEITKWVGLRL